MKIKNVQQLRYCHCKELVEVAAQYFNGIYLITPFLRYDVTLELMKYIEQLDEQKKE